MNSLGIRVFQTPENWTFKPSNSRKNNSSQGIRKIDSLYLVVFAFEEAHINVIWEDSEEKDGEITY